MRFRVELTDEAGDELRGLAPVPRRTVRRALDALSLDPFGLDTKELDDYPGRRRAIADGYRILYTRGDEPRTLSVFRIRPRGTAYEEFERTPPSDG